MGNVCAVFSYSPCLISSIQPYVLSSTLMSDLSELPSIVTYPCLISPALPRSVSCMLSCLISRTCACLSNLSCSVLSDLDWSVMTSSLKFIPSSLYISDLFRFAFVIFSVFLCLIWSYLLFVIWSLQYSCFLFYSHVWSYLIWSTLFSCISSVFLSLAFSSFSNAFQYMSCPIYVLSDLACLMLTDMSCSVMSHLFCPFLSDTFCHF